MTLRVGILTYDFYPFIGGQGRVTHDLWSRLRTRDDLDLRVISPARNHLPGHLIRAARTQRWGRHPVFSAVASLCARRWVRDLGLDILHVNGGPGGVLLLRPVGVPIVYSLYHTYEQVARLMPGHGWKTPVIALERAAYGRATRAIASTPSTQASLRRIDLRAPIEVIPCGVDGDAFPRATGPRDENIVLFVGRLDHRKAPGTLIDAFAGVSRHRSSARLVIIGRGPLESRLRRQVAELGLGDRVRFEHAVGHDELVGWYQRAAVVAAPSAFEGFGLSAVEAQSCGACVVATDSEGLRDVVIDGQTGMLAAGGQRALGERLLEALGDPALRRRLGAAAAEHVRQAYRWDHIIDEYARMYERTAAG